MRRVDDGGPVARVELTRRNLLTLLAKLDRPGSARTLVSGDGRAVVVAVPDEAHYADRAPGEVHPADLELMAQLEAQPER